MPADGSLGMLLLMPRESTVTHFTNALHPDQTHELESDWTEDVERDGSQPGPSTEAKIPTPLLRLRVAQSAGFVRWALLKQYKEFLYIKRDLACCLGTLTNSSRQLQHQRRPSAIIDRDLIKYEPFSNPCRFATAQDNIFFPTPSCSPRGNGERRENQHPRQELNQFPLKRAEMG
ncbi:uncharacterized protein CIMG_00168 [Coccidioides immitis RS]|uniref:Uncharacterized protein n=1 Tax=Coccidioides immitis (strain RS) TaxID=246410 RepID=A0A0E1RZ58_COCIM|nr:uncharacterized protein CIMG_00168 [Coccidioides immitis RS]EAS34814.2 hypothetical protein CIMG_00168 [Coccidioides immitis RS]